MKKTGALILFLTVLCGFVPLEAQTVYIMSLGNGSFSYNPETGSSGTISILLFCFGKTPYFVTFSAGNSGTFEPRKLRGSGTYTVDYNLYDNLTDRNILKDVSVPLTENNVLHGNMTNGFFNYVTRTFSFHVPPSAPSRGSYTDTITISAYAGSVSDSTHPNPQTTQWQISGTVSNVLNVFLTDTGAPYASGSDHKTLDFQGITTGEEMTADIMVGTNGYYDITVSSVNGSVLKHLNGGTIGYTFTSAGTSYNLSSPNTPVTLTMPHATPPAIDRFPVTIRIGAVDVWMDAGVYTDTINITVTAK